MYFELIFLIIPALLLNYYISKHFNYTLYRTILKIIVSMLSVYGVFVFYDYIDLKLNEINIAILGIVILVIYLHRRKIQRLLVEYYMIRILCGGLRPKFNNFLAKLAVRLAQLVCAGLIHKGLPYFYQLYHFIKTFYAADCPDCATACREEGESEKR